MDDPSANESQMSFMGLEFEADKPRMKVELRVVMADL